MPADCLNTFCESRNIPTSASVNSGNIVSYGVGETVKVEKDIYGNFVRVVPQSTLVLDSFPMLPPLLLLTPVLPARREPFVSDKFFFVVLQGRRVGIFYETRFVFNVSRNLLLTANGTENRSGNFYHTTCLLHAAS